MMQVADHTPWVGQMLQNVQTEDRVERAMILSDLLQERGILQITDCLLYTSDAADE